MDQRTTQILFALLCSAIRGTSLTEEEKNHYSPDLLQELFEISSKHDVIHLLVLGLKQNELITKETAEIERNILKAVYRYEKINYELTQVCKSLEKAQIPFIPLKGAVLRSYYPEPWMRTSCDIDILVHHKDLEDAVLYLSENLNYVEKERATHDVSLYSPSGIHVELHFDLVEEGRANEAIEVLRGVWDNVSLHENSKYWYEMADEFFYFYHIAHMAKHFEDGGCGIRPFIDLWILDRMENIDQTVRNDLLQKGGLFQFAEVSRRLSKVWMNEIEQDELSLQLEAFLIHGGAYGSADNRVALQQTKKGGRIGYIFSRIFIPVERLRRYYPILNRYPWLSPVMQIRRWFMLLRPDIAAMAKREIATNKVLEKSKADDMNILLKKIGL